MSSVPDPNSHDSHAAPRQATQPWLVIVLIVLVLFLILRNFDRTGLVSGPLNPRSVTQRGELRAEEQSQIELFRNAKDSVVFIQTTNYLLEQRRDLSQLSIEKIPVGIGTGFIWDEMGHIVTNYHVIANTATATVLLSDESAWEATILGASPERDIAVLKIDAPANRLQPITLGTSSDLQVGQDVFALGYPFGLNLTFTAGIISGLGQTLPIENGTEIRNAIQTDASINPGNSGGPLMDSAGRLIGMNTAIFTRERSASGFGFAIPVDEIRHEIKVISANPMKPQPRLGVLALPQLAVVQDQTAGESREMGARILAVHPESPAEKAGLQGFHWDESGNGILGDVILSVDGSIIDVPNKLNQILEKYERGDTVTLTILRGKQMGEVDVVLE